MKNSSRLKPHNDNKKQNLKFFILYTAVFAAAALAVLGYFLVLKKTFITPGDGYKQHFKAFVYFGQYCREVIRTLINEHSLVLPQYNFSIGFGGDIITTLHYYTIGDPLDLISIIVPAKYSIYVYTLLMIFRFYLSGLCFGIYCKYRKAGSDIAVIGGSLIYAFTTYSLYFAFIHPFFMNPVIYLPLLLLGVEKIFDGKRPYLLAVMVFISAISNFYFFYMLVVLTVIYVFFRLFFVYKKGEFKQAVGAVFKIGVSSVIGLVMSAAILVPVVIAFSSDSRTGEEIVVNLFYPAGYYKNFLSSYITSSASMGSMTCFGLSSVALVSLFLLFIKKGEKELKILFAISTIALMLPVTGYVMNGFSYIANRWIWAYVMLIAYIFVKMWESLKSISFKQGICLFAMLAVYGAAAFVCIKKLDINLIISLAVALVFIAVLIVTAKLGAKKAAGSAMIVLIIVSLSANSYFNSNESGNVNKENYYGYQSITEKLTDNAGVDVKNFATDDDSFYRYSGSNVTLNSDLVNGTRGTSFYWSLQNSAIAQFMDEMEIPLRYLYYYEDLDNRASLNALASVKYYTSSAFYNKPYGFGKVSDGIYKNANFLPIGYTYTDYITRDMYDAMSAVEKQQAIIQGVLLEEDVQGYNKLTPAFTQQIVDYDIVTDGNCSWENGKLTVNERNAQFTLYFDGLENSETYVNLDYNGYDAEKKPAGKLDFTVESATEAGKCAKNTYTINSKYSIRCRSIEHLLFNAGYSKAAKKSVTITVGAAGVYEIPAINVICQPMDDFKQQVKSLKEDVLKYVSVENDVIKGEITLDEDKILCLSVPYSTGWTAYVDGVQTDIMQANTMYMAIPLSAGSHSIKLVYTTPYLKAGVCLSAVGFVAFAGYIVYNELKLKKKKEY